MKTVNEIISEVIERFGSDSLEVKRGQFLSEISSFRIGGPADFVIYPHSESVLIYLMELHGDGELPYIIVGKSSNILFGDDTHHESVISTVHMDRYGISGTTLICEAGVSLPIVSKAVADHGLSGFEGLAGIPGTVGGAVYMNAGAFGCEIADTIVSARCYDTEKREIVVLTREALALSYRKSILSDTDRYVVLSAEFSLNPRPTDDIIADMKRNREKRLATQPTGFPSAGSVFKRPENASAGALIDQAGMKGVFVGGAEVSEKHAGFIINRGGATAQDVLELIELIRNKILELYGISLECEIELK